LIAWCTPYSGTNTCYTEIAEKGKFTKKYCYKKIDDEKYKSQTTYSDDGKYEANVNIGQNGSSPFFVSQFDGVPTKEEIEKHEKIVKAQANVLGTTRNDRARL
jgi:hypothetical protein